MTCNAKNRLIMCPHENNNARSNAEGFLNQIFKASKSSLMICVIRWRNFSKGNIPTSRAGDFEYHFPNRKRPEGSSIAIPNMLTRRSTTIDAAQTARLYPNWIMLPTRKTSPPTVVGKKFDANKPVKVIDVVCAMLMSTSPDRRRICQRAMVNKRDKRRRPIAEKKRSQVICRTAFHIPPQLC